MSLLFVPLSFIDLLWIDFVSNYILCCVCLCSFLFGELACAFVQYTMHFTQHCCVCYTVVCFSAFDVSLCGFLECLSVCLFPVAFALLFFASSSMFLKCLSFIVPLAKNIRFYSGFQVTKNV